MKLNEEKTEEDREITLEMKIRALRKTRNKERGSTGGGPANKRRKIEMDGEIYKYGELLPPKSDRYELDCHGGEEVLEERRNKNNGATEIIEAFPEKGFQNFHNQENGLEQKIDTKIPDSVPHLPILPQTQLKPSLPTLEHNLTSVLKSTENSTKVDPKVESKTVQNISSKKIKKKNSLNK